VGIPSAASRLAPTPGTLLPAPAPGTPASGSRACSRSQHPYPGLVHPVPRRTLDMLDIYSNTHILRVNSHWVAEKNVNKNTKKMPGCVYQYTQSVPRKKTQFRAGLKPEPLFFALYAEQNRDAALRVDRVPLWEWGFPPAKKVCWCRESCGFAYPNRVALA